jgi:hypothetical protein
MKKLKLFVSVVPFFVVALSLLLGAGCASSKSETSSRLGTQSSLDLNDQHVHFLGSYDGSSTGGRVLFIGGSPSGTTAEKRAKAAATADAIAKGINPTSLRFVNSNPSKSGVPLIIAGFKTVSVSIDAYYIDNGENKPATPAAVSAPASTPTATPAPLAPPTGLSVKE